jgi:hypothetical protein
MMLFEQRLTKLAIILLTIWTMMELPPSFSGVAQPGGELIRHISIAWKARAPQGRIVVTNGSLVDMKVQSGNGEVRDKDHFNFTREATCRLDLELKQSGIRSGMGSTVVTVQTERDSFTFFLRDVNSRYPIYIPAYAVIVTESTDGRPYEKIVEEVAARGLQTNLQYIEQAPEETFTEAASRTREIKSETWLGLSRDFRLFAVGERLDWIEPRFHAFNVYLPEKKVRYDFLMGRGWGPVDKISRRLEEGHLPILQGTLADDGIVYRLTAFVTLEKSKLSLKTLRGTHFLVGEGYGYTNDVVHPAPQGLRPWPDKFKEMFPSLLQEEMNQPEETVLMMSVEMLNTASVPRYAWFRSPSPAPLAGLKYDTGNGFTINESNQVFVISTLDGKPLPAQEVGLLLKPGEVSRVEVRIPHRPISVDRVLHLAQTNFSEIQEQCRQFWREKLATGAQISLPEERVNEMLRAGLLHLDLITYGLEPSGTLAPSVGVYTPIGSESVPIILFMDSMGWHDVARRSANFFLEKQHDNGFMQNYGDYRIETAGALYALGEHYRYTRDDTWVKQIEPKLLKACDYILEWRRRNKREDLRGKGYGLLDGKVGDPNDTYRSFMFSGYHYLAIKRVSEMLKSVDPSKSDELAREADDFRKDIRTAFFEIFGRSPVMPLADGSWCTTMSPYADYPGALSLYAEGGKWYTHGALNVRDSVVGPLWLVFQEILEPNEFATVELLNFHNELLTERSVSFSQPYYSPHPYVHLMRGEAKPFLKAYYNTVASMADRETYSFFEHFMGGPNKTHEEAWFLMQTRWMLYMERGDTLQLLAGIPRSYLENGKKIELTRVASYFGPVSLQVNSELNQGRIRAKIECKSERRPTRVVLRLAHPEGQKATWVKGGVYDPVTEQVTIEKFDGRAEITLGFDMTRQNH